MSYPKEVLEIVDKATRKYPENIPQSARVAEREARKLPIWGDLMANLAATAFRGLCYAARHKSATAIKNAAGEFGGPPKVIVGRSKGVNRTAQSVYLMSFGSSTLGALTGEEYLPIAESEEAIGRGHYANARLARALNRLVPAKKHTRDVLSEKKLNAVVAAAMQEPEKAPEAAKIKLAGKKQKAA